MRSFQCLITLVSRTSFSSLVLIPVSVAFLMLGGCMESVIEEPVVIANGEELHGSWEGANSSVATFKGIPFAAPPVGELRWRAPAAHQPRPGPQKATEFARACMQTDYMTVWYADVAEVFGSGRETAARPAGVSEDCLYLNVWSPGLNSDSELPVMIWVHGGSNKGGWSYEPNYLGAKLAAKGVVVVTIAYRLGAFGFFSHPVLDNGANQPAANFGALDIIHAVEWVKDNIAAFGGDPENITLLGESAGSGNISDLVAMEAAVGPAYQRLILQSSASGMRERRTLAEDQALGVQLVQSMGIEEPLTADQLRNLTAEQLLAASMTALPGHYYNAVIDGLTMKLSPIENLRQGGGGDLDVLIGTNADEWYMYMDENASRADLEKSIDDLAPVLAPALMAEVSQITDVRRALDRVHTASNMLCPSRYLAASVSASGGHSWVYHFTRQRPGPGGEKLGAYHGTEIPYVFDMHDAWLPNEDIDHEITAAVMDYWIQFARSGDPNLPNRPQWPAYDSNDPTVMELGDTIDSVKPKDTVLCELLGPGQKEKAQVSR
jgi:para-nitrobenzyl esterase